MTHSAPDHAAVLALHREGGTPADIAVELNLPRPLVDMIIERHTRRPGIALASLPWTIAPRHEQDEDARMLRLEQVRRAGGSLDAGDLEALSDWHIRLQDSNSVVTYSPSTGFSWVGREDTDRDLVRLPEGA